jgi:hypothetical protein
MKLKLATAAVLMALASRGALAASEGGDTWSDLQPQPYAASEHAASYSPAAVATTANLSASEGGDTWSELQPQPYVASEHEALDTPVVVATAASLSTLRSAQPSAAFGTSVQDSAADRTVQLGPRSHWINVGYGETIEFVVPGSNGSERSFTWKFDVSPEVSRVDLSEVAPAQFLDHEVQVFVAPNPLYIGG